MSVYSMTGYASAGVSVAIASTGAALRPDSRSEAKPEGSPPSGGTVTAEVRSVNGRFLDLSLKLPDDLRGLEPALRERVAAAVKRGKVELRLAMGGPDWLLRQERLEHWLKKVLPPGAFEDAHRLVGVHMLFFHEPTRLVTANGQQGQIKALGLARGQACRDVGVHGGQLPLNSLQNHIVVAKRPHFGPCF